jgi:hypothetical protein
VACNVLQELVPVVSLHAGAAALLQKELQEQPVPLSADTAAALAKQLASPAACSDGDPSLQGSAAGSTSVPETPRAHAGPAAEKALASAGSSSSTAAVPGYMRPTRGVPSAQAKGAVQPLPGARSRGSTFRVLQPSEQAMRQTAAAAPKLRAAVVTSAPARARGLQAAAAGSGSSEGVSAEDGAALPHLRGAAEHRLIQV